MNRNTKSQSSAAASTATAPLPPIHHLLSTASTHWGKALFVGALAGVLTSAVLLTQPPVYEARNVVLIQMSRDHAFIPDVSVSGIRTPDPGDLSAFVNAEIQVMNSSAVLNSALESLIAEGVFETGLHSDVTALFEGLEDATSIGLITGSNLIEMTVRDNDPERARKIAEALLTAYKSVRPRLIGTDPPAFLTARLDAAQARLGEIDAALADLASRLPPDLRDGAALDPGSADATDLRAAEEDVAGLSARVASLETLRADAAQSPEQADRIATLLTEATADLARAQAVRDAIAARTASSDASGASPDSLRTDVAVLQAKRDALLDVIAGLEARREAGLIADARDQEGLGTLRIIEQAQARGEVSLPSRLKVIGAIAVGLLAAFATILVLHAANATRRKTWS